MSNANERVASEKLTVEEVFRKLKWQSAYRVEGVRWEAGQPVVAPSDPIPLVTLGVDLALIC